MGVFLAICLIGVALVFLCFCVHMIHSLLKESSDERMKNRQALINQQLLWKKRQDEAAEEAEKVRLNELRETLLAEAPVVKDLLALNKTCIFKGEKLSPNEDKNFVRARNQVYGFSFEERLREIMTYYPARAFVSLQDKYDNDQTYGAYCKAYQKLLKEADNSRQPLDWEEAWGDYHSCLREKLSKEKIDYKTEPFTFRIISYYSSPQGYSTLSFHKDYSETEIRRAFRQYGDNSRFTPPKANRLKPRDLPGYVPPPPAFKITLATTPKNGFAFSIYYLFDELENEDAVRYFTSSSQEGKTAILGCLKALEGINAITDEDDYSALIELLKKTGGTYLSLIDESSCKKDALNQYFEYLREQGEAKRPNLQENSAIELTELPKDASNSVLFRITIKADSNIGLTYSTVFAFEEADNADVVRFSEEASITSLAAYANCVNVLGALRDVASKKDYQHWLEKLKEAGGVNLKDVAEIGFNADTIETILTTRETRIDDFIAKTKAQKKAEKEAALKKQQEEAAAVRTVDGKFINTELGTGTSCLSTEEGDFVYFPNQELTYYGKRDSKPTSLAEAGPKESAILKKSLVQTAFDVFEAGEKGNLSFEALIGAVETKFGKKAIKRTYLQTLFKPKEDSISILFLARLMKRDEDKTQPAPFPDASEDELANAFLGMLKKPRLSGLFEWLLFRLFLSYIATNPQEKTTPSKIALINVADYEAKALRFLSDKGFGSALLSEKDRKLIEANGGISSLEAEAATRMLLLRLSNHELAENQIANKYFYDYSKRLLFSPKASTATTLSPLVPLASRLMIAHFAALLPESARSNAVILSDQIGNYATEAIGTASGSNEILAAEFRFVAGIEKSAAHFPAEPFEKALQTIGLTTTNDLAYVTGLLHCHSTKEGGQYILDNYKDLYQAILLGEITQGEMNEYHYSNPTNDHEYNETLHQLENNLCLFDCGHGLYKTNRFFVENGISNKDFWQMVNLIYRRLQTRPFFSLDELRKHYEAKPLMKLLNDEWLLQVCRSRIKVNDFLLDKEENIILYSTLPNKDIEKALFDLIFGARKKMEIYDIASYVEDEFALSYNLDKIGKDAVKAGYFYSDELEMVYKNKKDYLKEIYQ